MGKNKNVVSVRIHGTFVFSEAVQTRNAVNSKFKKTKKTWSLLLF